MRVPLAPAAERTLMPMLSLVETRLSQADFSESLAANAVTPALIISRTGAACGTNAAVAPGFSTIKTRPIHGVSDSDSLAFKPQTEQIKTIAGQNFIIQERSLTLRASNVTTSAHGVYQILRGPTMRRLAIAFYFSALLFL